MPINNIFLWAMLILAGLLSYQLLFSYTRAEHRASRVGQYGTSAQHHNYSRKTRVKRTYQQSGRRLRGPVQSPSIHHNYGRAGFMTVDISQNIDTSRFSEISYQLPGLKPQSDSNMKEIMTDVSDCHYCA